MKTPEEKAGLLRQQVISKIHWGARPQEVEEWLQEKHGITGDEARQLLAAAYGKKRTAVRTRAAVRVVLSGIGMIIVGLFAYTRFSNPYIFVGTASVGAMIAAAGLGVLSCSTFFRNLRLLISGDTQGSVD